MTIRFVVTEGPDGCGKGYCDQDVDDMLVACDPRARIIHTQTPTRMTKAGRLLRDKILPSKEEIDRIGPQGLARLFVTDMVKYKRWVELEHPDCMGEGRNLYVIAQRWWISTLIYQGAMLALKNGGTWMEQAKEYIEPIVHIEPIIQEERLSVPFAVLVFYAPPSDLNARIRNRENQTATDTNKKLQQAVRDAYYRDLPVLAGQNWQGLGGRVFQIPNQDGVCYISRRDAIRTALNSLIGKMQERKAHAKKA